MRLGITFTGSSEAPNGKEITTIALGKRHNPITSQTFEDDPETDTVRVHLDKRRQPVSLLSIHVG